MFLVRSYPQRSSVLSFFGHRQPYAIASTLLASLILFSLPLFAQDKIVWRDREKPIVEQLHGLRKLDDTVRARTSKDLALQIRQLPVAPNKVRNSQELRLRSERQDGGAID
jgi:hypothetical protein